MTVVMSAAAREEFLAAVGVGVLSVAAGRPGQTLAVSVWYSYQPGGLLTVLARARPRRSALPAGSACVSRTPARPTGMSVWRGPS